MGIQVDALRISGFRGIDNLELSLPRIAVLIGTNNSGKTSILKAMNLALGDYQRRVCEEDLRINDNGIKSDQIIVDVRIRPIDENGQPSKIFSEVWQAEFGGAITAEADGQQFVGIRTISMPNVIKGGFETLRYRLTSWPPLDKWQEFKINRKDTIKRFESLPLVSIEAQRDIHGELRDRNSFIGKILASVEYNADTIVQIEDQIKTLNENAVNESNVLKRVATHLEKLNQSFQGDGKAEVTPFPKKLRDLAKNFSINFGETSAHSYPMEYHGMGTRSWASMLTVKAFLEMIENQATKEQTPLHSVMCAEEPEAHLHPNAQKTLYGQLANINGQVIISTHSPYIVSMADISSTRSVSNKDGGIAVKSLSENLNNFDKKILSREITLNRGEILFSTALILCEGITEEQVIPSMFFAATNFNPNELGVTCCNVKGKNYGPYLRLACSLGIPVCILGDNDKNSKAEVESQIAKAVKAIGPLKNMKAFYLGATNDFEAELMSLNLRDELIEAATLAETQTTDNEKYWNAKKEEISKLNNESLLALLRSQKSAYSGFLADLIKENKSKKTTADMIPSAVLKTIEAIKTWLSK